MRRTSTAVHDATANKGAPPPIDDDEGEEEVLEPDQLVEKSVRHVEAYTVVEPARHALVTAPASQSRPEPVITEPSPMEEFLASLGGGAGHILRVDRLPDYKITGHFGPGSKYVYCGDLPFSPENYLQLIQNTYGGGDYRLTLKNAARQLVKTWIEQVADPRPQRLADGSVSAAQVAPLSQFAPGQSQGLPAEMVDPFENFVKMAEKLGRLRKVMGWDTEPTRVQQAVVTTPAAPAVSLEQRIFEGLLGMAGNNTDIADRLMRKYLEPEQSGWGSMLENLLFPLVEKLAPLAPALVVAWMKNQGVTAEPPAPVAGAPVARRDTGFRTPGAALQSLSVAEQWSRTPHTFTGRSDQWCELCNLPDRHAIHTLPINAAPPGPATPYAPPLPSPENDELQEGYMELIDDLVKMLDLCIRRGAVDPAVIDQGYADVKRFQESTPEFAQFVESLASTFTPEMVIGLLLGTYPELTTALTQVQASNRIALDAIAALQTKLKGDQP